MNLCSIRAGFISFHMAKGRAAVALFALMLLGGNAQAYPRADCIGDEGGTVITPGSVLQNAVNAANGGTVVLCQKAQFEVSGSIVLPAYTKLQTRALPVGDAFKARIYYKPGSGLQQGRSVLDANGRSGVELRNLIVDGSRNNVNIERTTGNATKWRALIAISGQNSLMDRVRAVNAVGGGVIAAADDVNCNNLRITNSFIGYSGFAESEQWADGIGLYCSNAYIANNELRDITDGAITFYGGTNTIIESNWIANSGRSAISGIIAAGAQKRTFGANFAGFNGSVFRNNLIETEGGQRITIALSAGSRMWCDAAQNNPDCDMVSGLSIVNNQGSGTYGYGIVVAGMSNATVAGNNLIMTPWNNPGWTGPRARCVGVNWYVVETGSGGSLQPGYTLRPNVGGCAWF